MFLLGFVGTAFLGTRGMANPSNQVRQFGLRSYLLKAESRNEGPQTRGGSRCGDVPPESGDVIKSELGTTNVGAMLGRAGEEEILKPLTICENYRPTRGS